MPDWKPEIRARLSAVRLAPARQEEIVEELSQHLDDRWRELIAAGATTEEAEGKARGEFSTEDVLAPYLSALRQAHWADPAPPGSGRALSLQGLGADVRQSVRGLRTAPSFTIAALLVLTLGIGATTAIFAVVDAVVLRGLPFDDPDRIVAVGERVAMAKGKKGPFEMPGSAPPTDPQVLSAIEPQNYLDWAVQQRVFESIAAVDAYGESTLLLPDAPPEAIMRSRVTAAFFDVLRARAATGRVFSADNEVDGRDRVAVLSDAFCGDGLAAIRPSSAGRFQSTAGRMKCWVSCRRGSRIPSARFNRRSFGCRGSRRQANVYADGCAVSICRASLV